MKRSINNKLNRWYRKRDITRHILEALPEWFEIAEGREEYICDSVGKIFLCALEEDKPLGFLYLKQTGKDTVELAVMGVLKEYHQKGIGRKLFECAKKIVSNNSLFSYHKTYIEVWINLN